MLISLMTRAGWRWIFCLSLGLKQQNTLGTDDTGLDISRSRGQRECKIAPGWHVCSGYFLFPFYFVPEGLSWGNLCIESPSATFYRYLWECHRMWFWECLTEVSRVLLFAEFVLEIDGKILSWIFLVDFVFGWTEEWLLCFSECSWSGQKS